jgi:hypothetical protein
MIIIQYRRDSKYDALYMLVALKKDINFFLRVMFYNVYKIH